LDFRFRAAWLSAGRALGAAVLRGRRSGNDNSLGLLRRSPSANFSQ